MAGHHHHHDHDHHNHGVQLKDQGPAFRLGIALNLGYVIAEVAAGLMTGSMALLADAGHNLSDVLGLALAWAAVALAARPATARFTFGLGRSTILAALANAMILLAACGAIAVEAVRRLQVPEPVPGGVVMLVAGIGVVINLATAMLFLKGRKDDLNIRGAYLHMMADAGISAAVVVAGLLILLTGAHWIDAALSLLVVALIVRGTWGLLKESLAAVLDAVPPHIDPLKVRTALLATPGVAAVHDLHIWPMTTSQVALTAHLVMPGGHPGDAAIGHMAHAMAHDFGIVHATFQIEAGVEACPAPCAMSAAMGEAA
ncbi:cobalt-zinc-cadmium efflux system protein [Polymorphobacter multimanifer]|uniref:Cobalt-zinc-cadmium efflux system protein n=1 Tax=Polymorphobacter multimanifer TaxID=1070431 RepID=A0A841L440_9SPHN|nr:cation diffusion facilitator family transporter [Polymorphobacter multimanifer]MBB6227190.1 cobalt-zinc-cadmium efflux system protein [Polymorphobacter multimanifer]